METVNKTALQKHTIHTHTHTIRHVTQFDQTHKEKMLPPCWQLRIFNTTIYHRNADDFKTNNTRFTHSNAGPQRPQTVRTRMAPSIGDFCGKQPVNLRVRNYFLVVWLRVTSLFLKTRPNDSLAEREMKRGPAVVSTMADT